MTEACLVLTVLHDLSSHAAPLPSVSPAFQPSLSRIASLTARLRTLETASQVQGPPPVASLALALGKELQRLRATLFSPPLPLSVLQLEQLLTRIAPELAVLECVAKVLLDGAKEDCTVLKDSDDKQKRWRAAEVTARAIDGAVRAMEMQALSQCPASVATAARLLKCVLHSWLAMLERWLTRGETCTTLPFAVYSPPPPPTCMPLFAQDVALLQLLTVAGNAAALAPMHTVPYMLAAELENLLFDTAPILSVSVPLSIPSSFFSPPPPLSTPSLRTVRTYICAYSPLLRQWLMQRVRTLSEPLTRAALHTVRRTYALEQHLAALHNGPLLASPSLHLYFVSRALNRPPPLDFADAAREACGAHGALLQLTDDGGIQCDLPPALSALLLSPDASSLYSSVSVLLVRLLTARTRLVEGRFALQRREQLHWLTSLEGYVRQSVIEPSWARMMHTINTVDTTEQVSAAHAAFIAHVRERLFLSIRHAPLQVRLDALLQLCEAPVQSGSAWRAEMHLLIGLLSRAAALRHAPHRRFDMTGYYLQS